MSNALLIRRRGMMQAMGAGHIEIEYLQCLLNGESFINVPIDCKVGQLLTVNFKIRLLSTNSVNFIVDNTGTQFAVWLRQNKIASRIGGTVTLNGPTYSDISVSKSFTFSSANHPISEDISYIKFFRGNQLSPGVNFYSIAIMIDGNVVRDLIPVRVGTVGYMYDRVSGQLFGNDGTGDFILGPDIQ